MFINLPYLKQTTLEEALTHMPGYDEALNALMARMGWGDDKLHVIEHALLSEAIGKAQEFIADVRTHEETQADFVEILRTYAEMEREKAPALQCEAPTAAETVGASRGR